MSAIDRPGVGSLPDLVRPRFFPGQLLTDQNLTDLVAWVQARAGLERLREGWGVVCGLGVTAGRTPPSPSPAGGAARRPELQSVCVMPGYAVDRAGNPLVLRAPLAKDLPRVTDPTGGQCPPLPPSEEKLTVGPFEGAPQSRWAVFDLLLCHDLKEADLVASPSGPHGRRCEPTRFREGAKLDWVRRAWTEIDPPGAEEDPDPGAEFLERFKAAFEDVFTFPTTLPTPPERVAKVRTWLMKQMEQSPALGRTFPALGYWLSEYGERELSTPWGVARVLFWMADAARRRASAPCPETASGCPAAGVPLARVWAEAHGSYYAVRFLDDAPPYRRPYGPEATAALHPRTYVGRRWEDVGGWEGVRQALNRLQVSAEKQPFELPADGAHLLACLRREAEIGTGFVPGGDDEYAALVSEKTDTDTGHAEPLAGRVIAFQNADAAKPPLTEPRASLDVGLFAVEPGGEQSQPPQLVAQLPEDRFRVTAGYLPAGGWVRLGIKLTGFLFTQGAPHTIYYHDELHGKLHEVGNADQPNKFVVTTLQLPDASRWDDVRVTLVARSQSGDRLAALTGLIRGEKDGKVVPLKVVSGTTGDLQPLPSVSPFEAGGGGPGEDKLVVVLDGAKDPAVPVKATLPHALPKPVQAKLRFKKEEPTKLDPESLASDGTEVGTVGDSQTVVGLPRGGVGDKAWFWLIDGRDGFGRKIRPIPRDSGLTFKMFALSVSFKNEGASGAQKPVLVLTNNHQAEMKLQQVTARQLNPAGPEKTVLNPETSLASGAAKEFRAAEGLEGQAAASTWRVVVKFKVGTDSKVLAAAIHVGADAPTS